MAISGLVAIVSGASGGIGSATARAFADAGVHVILAALDEPALYSAAEEVRSRGVRALAVPVDVSNRADIDRLVALTPAEFGRIDILANVAGIGSSPSIGDSTDEELE